MLHKYFLDFLPVVLFCCFFFRRSFRMLVSTLAEEGFRNSVLVSEKVCHSLFFSFYLFSFFSLSFIFLFFSYFVSVCIFYPSFCDFFQLICFF